MVRGRILQVVYAVRKTWKGLWVIFDSLIIVILFLFTSGQISVYSCISLSDLWLWLIL